MIPGEYDIDIYEGDTYYGPLITLPDFSPFGGPSDLVGATVTAELKKKEADLEPVATFAVTVVNATLRQIRVTLTPAQTSALAIRQGVWDLQIERDGWVGTPLKGMVTLHREVTR